MLSHAFTQPCTILTNDTDIHGDQVGSSGVETLCRFRYATEVDRGVNREGLTTVSDAILWLAPEEPVVEGQIIQVDGKSWRVDRLIKARRLKSAAVLFLKCYVNAHAV